MGRNAAYRLAEMIGRWDVPGYQDAATTRAEVAGDTGIWAQHSRAARLLVEVEQHLEHMVAAGADVEDYLDTVPEWHKAVTAFNTDWRTTANNTRPVIDRRDLKSLRQLGLLIEEGGYAPPPVRDASALMTTLESAKALVTTNVYLDRQEKRRLHGLIAEAMKLVALGDTVSTTRLNATTTQLGGQLLATAMAIPADDDTRQTFAELARDIVAQVVAAAPVAMISTVITQAMLTQ